jgi:hypothetical protein
MNLNKPYLIKKIHSKADSMNVIWDNDPNFMDWTNKITGERHLDDMNIDALLKIYALISLGKYGRTLTAEADLYLHRALSAYISPRETEKVRDKMEKMYQVQNYKEEPRFVKLKKAAKKIRNKMNVQRIGEKNGK